MADTAMAAGGKSGMGMAVGEPRKALVLLSILLVVLPASGVGAAQVLNPSFETAYSGQPWPRLLPLNWGHRDEPSFSSCCTNLWSTDGSKSAALFNLIDATVSAGQYQSFYQFIDLTGVGSIEFDVLLTTYPPGVFEHFEASLLVGGRLVGGRIVGGQVLWRETQGGVHRNQQANVAALPGLQPVELRITALDAGKYDTAYWVEWDNLRVQEGPTTTPARVELDPNTLNPDSNGKWITGRIELEAGYDVGNIDGATVTLNGIPAYIGKQGWAAPLVNADNVADFDADGVLERMVKFERAAVQAIASAPQTTVTVKGRLVNGTPFEGQATIRVLGPQAQKP